MFSDMNSIRRKTQQNDSYSPLAPANEVVNNAHITLASGHLRRGNKAKYGTKREH
jgi:hypothetical protein